MKTIKYIGMSMFFLTIVIIAYYISLKVDGAETTRDVSKFIKSRPNSMELQEYLKERGLDFQKIINKPLKGSTDVSANRDYDLRPVVKISFRVFNVRKSWCGISYDHYIVTFDKKGAFSGSNSFRGSMGCDL